MPQRFVSSCSKNVLIVSTAMNPDEAVRALAKMKNLDGITPSLEHYNQALLVQAESGKYDVSSHLFVTFTVIVSLE